VAGGTDARLNQVYGATRFPDNPLWYYPAFYPLYKKVLADLKALKVTAEFSDTAVSRLKTLATYDDNIANLTLPAGMAFKTNPYKHQREGLVHAYYYLRSALFYSCGLGKTKIIIDWQRITGCKVLVLCPKVVMKTWAKELKVHGIEQEYRLVDAATKKKKLTQISEAKDYPGMIISYDSAKRYMEEIAAELPYTAIVADESHYIKNGRSARTKAALELSKKAHRRVIMSGTPSLGDPRDLHPQFYFLSPTLMPEPFWKFRMRFCKVSRYNKYIVVGFKNLDIIHDRVATVALRRKKEECLDLPPRSIIDIHVPLAPKQRRLYNTLYATSGFDDLLAQLISEEKLLSGAGTLDTPNVAVMINKLIQVTCGFVYKKEDLPDICSGCEHVRDCVNEIILPYSKQCKVNQTPPQRLVEHLADNAKKEMLRAKLEEILADPENKVIIWGQFIAELDIIEDVVCGLWNKDDHKSNWLEGEQPYHVRVDSNSSGEGPEIAERFNTDKNCRAYVGQVATCEGLTLNAANYMIYNSIPWKLKDYEQSIDRNHRIGQDRPLTVFRLLGEGTVDLDVARALNVKATVSETMTSVIVCNTCKHREGCEAKIFSKDCVYSRSVSRPITKVREL
jgi:SNF2 family DNA or RNA helicase